MSNITIENLKQKATLLNLLSNNEEALFNYINTNQDNLDEVIQQYKPENEFRPVNTLRFLIANELKKGNKINAEVINQLKQAIENRDVSGYYSLSEIVKQSLINYKQSKVGMFPNWKQVYKILFPFIHNQSDNEQVKAFLNQLADEIITSNQFQNVTKHIVSFQGPQNYGADHAWVAIIPESSPSVQYAYQMFFVVDVNGLTGGIHKGHNLTKQQFENQDLQFNHWEDYLEHTKNAKDHWEQLNSNVNFIFINDEKAFVKTLKKNETSALLDYFKIIDRLKEDLDIQDEEKLVFSIAKNRLSFQVGKRYCLNVKNKAFDFISNNDLLGNNNREAFSGAGSSYLYNGRNIEDVINNYEDIKSSVEIEIERDNHAQAKFYDNSAFRKAVFDEPYRERIFEQNGITNNYYLVGAYWDSYNPKDQTNRFVDESIWINGYDDKFNSVVNKIKIGDRIAIKSTYVREKTKSVMLIKATGVVSENLNDGQHLKVNWENDFKTFEVDFTGGYRATVKQVINKEHINRIWNNQMSMRNLKIEFVNWLINKPKSNYFNNDIEVLNRYLDTYNSYFSIDIFEVKKSNYINVIQEIDKVAYQDENSDFFKYSEGESTHRPRAILGKTNYFQFLKEKFNSPSLQDGTVYKAPLNQIFYGPPGTGKTYNTILEAAKIITQNPEITYSEALVEFNNNLGDQIEFVTFHQNYSYEDFIQGIRPDTELSGELSFFKKDGIFKIIADRALKNLKDSENPESAKKDFDRVFHEFIEPLNDGGIYELKVKMKQTSFYITEVGEKSIEFRKNQGDSKHTLSINTLRKMYDKGVNDIILGGLQPYYNPVLSELLKKGKSDVERVAKQNYVIIIDEINRANISRVFGELITLIEKDKRSHGKIPLTATLPSGESFIVPSNLYIVGTMNTADKSIALLDIALRRRFEFVPMYPDSKSTVDKVVNDSTILDAINKEIINRKGHDFTIGHSYFMGEDYDLKNTIDNKVIPLLLEYFMNDFEEVKKILSAANITVDGWPMQYIVNDN